MNCLQVAQTMYTLTRKTTLVRLEDSVSKPKWVFQQQLRLPTRPCRSSWYERWKEKNVGFEQFWPAEQHSASAHFSTRKSKGFRSEFATLFVEAQAEPLNDQADFLAMCLTLMTAAFLLWNRFETTSVLCVVVYLAWGFRALVATVRDALDARHPNHVAGEKFKRAGAIAVVIVTCLMLSLGLGWASSPVLRVSGQRMVMGQMSTLLYTAALCSMEVCALAKVVRWLASGFFEWKQKVDEAIHVPLEPSKQRS